jgi:serine protease Do
VKVKIIRNNEEKLLTIKMDQQPESMSGRKYVTIKTLLGQASLGMGMGLAIEDLPQKDKERHGVIVRHVVSDSPAERAGILPGDIILKVGSSEINSLNEFQTVLQGFIERGVPVSMFIKSKGYVTLNY